MMSTPLRRTMADLGLLPDDGNRQEIIDRELHLTGSPSWEHQNASVKLVYALEGRPRHH